MIIKEKRKKKTRMEESGRGDDDRDKNNLQITMYFNKKVFYENK